jgi:hypothetical protein
LELASPKIKRPHPPNVWAEFKSRDRYFVRTPVWISHVF